MRTCIRCDEAPAVTEDGYCGHCHWAVRTEVDQGLYELGGYLTGWARFADYCDQHGLATATAAVTVLVAVVLAGCAARTVTATKVVRGHPCDTRARMTGCVKDMARAVAAGTGMDPGSVRGRCSRSGRHGWRCVMRVRARGLGVICVTSLVTETPRLGLPSVTAADYAPTAVCDKLFGIA